jgi:hypothetical protein
MTCTTRADQGEAEGGAHATLGRCSSGSFRAILSLVLSLQVRAVLTVF